MTTARLLLIVLIAILGVGWVRAEVRAHNRETVAAEALTNAAAREAEALGYLVTLQHVTGELVFRDSTADSLASALRKAEARVVIHTVVEATAEVDTVVTADTTYADCGGETTFSYDPFYGRVSFTPPDSFALVIDAKVRGELFHSFMPDGRLLVGARSLSPNVEFKVPTVQIETPHEDRPSRWGYILAAGIGAVAWELIR